MVHPGFPRGGGINAGVPTYDFAQIYQKLHEIERIWTPGGVRAPLDLPLISLILILASPINIIIEKCHTFVIFNIFI